MFTSVTPPVASVAGREAPKGASAFSGSRVRANVYVDGFNLYYGCLKGTPFRTVFRGQVRVPSILTLAVGADHHRGAALRRLDTEDGHPVGGTSGGVTCGQAPPRGGLAWPYGGS